MATTKNWIFVILLLALLGGAAIWLQSPDPQPSNQTNEVTQTAQSMDTPSSELAKSDDELSSQDSTDTEVERELEPQDIAAFREAHGYYTSGGNDVGAKHPYEYLDELTLRGLAEQQDGLAQLVLADRLSNSDLNEAIPFYLEAAANGKTAALVNIAASQLVVNPGTNGFGFETIDEAGVITDEYLNVLQYYAAAEALGDFVGTEMLAEHIASFNLNGENPNIARVCKAGNAISQNIENVRLSRWGEKSLGETPIESIEIPQPICGQ